MELKSFAWGLCVGITVMILRSLRGRKKSIPRLEYQREVECLLFNPQTIHNLKNYNGFCYGLTCSHCSYQRLHELILGARVSIEICMYVITSDELTKLLIDLFQYRKIVLKIVTDKQMNEQASKSKLLKFLKNHVPVKVVKTNDIMHNKFIIIDNRLLITGSLNWTKQGFLRNFENAVVIYNSEVVRQFSYYFADMWLFGSFM